MTSGKWHAFASARTHIRKISAMTLGQVSKIFKLDFKKCFGDDQAEVEPVSEELIPENFSRNIWESQIDLELRGQTWSSGRIISFFPKTRQETLQQ